MFELLVTVCLAHDLKACKDVSLVFSDESITQLQFTMGIAGHSEIAKWTEAHPKWVAKRWRCQPTGRFAKA